MTNKLTPALCDYLKELGLPIVVVPSTNTEINKIEIIMYICNIEQTIVDGKETSGNVKKILDGILKSSYVGEK